MKLTVHICDICGKEHESESINLPAGWSPIILGAGNSQYYSYSGAIAYKFELKKLVCPTCMQTRFGATASAEGLKPDEKTSAAEKMLEWIQEVVAEEVAMQTGG